MSVLAAIVGALIGWGLGRLTKRIEFRWDLLQRASASHQNLVKASTEYQWKFQAYSTSRNLPDLKEKVRAEEMLFWRVNEARLLSPTILHFFQEAASEWIGMTGAFLALRDCKALGEVERNVERAEDEWETFEKRAVEKCDFFFPWGKWRTRIVSFLTMNDGRVE